MLPYFCLLILVFVLGVEARNKDYISNLMGETCWGGYRHTEKTTVYFAAASALIILMTALRYYVGSDYSIYMSMTSLYSMQLEERLLTLSEPAYPLIARICSFFTPDPVLAISTCAVITIALAMITIYRNSGDLLFSLLLYLFIVWTETMNIARQELAVAVVFCGYTFARDRKIIPYMLCVFLAFLCHVSAFFMVFAYFFFQMKLKGRTILLLAAVSLLFFALSESLLELAIQIVGKDVYRGSNFYVTSVRLPRIIVNFAPAAFALWVYRGKELTSDEAFCVKGCLLHGFLAIATAQVVYLSRVCWYTAPFICIGLPELMKGVKGKNRKIFTILILVLFFAYWVYDIASHQNLNNFTWIWQR